MPEFLFRYKEKIDSYLSFWLKTRGRENSYINSFSTEVADDLAAFSALGKTIRGALVFVGSSLFDLAADTDLVKTAAAVELFQSGLLIHDDIMDRDLTRRGQPSIFALYADRYSRPGQADALHLGESLGICAGDMAFFHAFELLAALDCPPVLNMALHRLFSSEMLIVATAQMQDVVFGENESFPRTEQILSLYRYKTGRYTFSLPLAAGALLSGAGKKERETLEKIGELMGIVFQIRDDELGLSGNEDHLGKPVGSDVAEGKKTLPLALLYQSLKEKEAEKMLSIFKSGEKSDDDIRYVTGLYAEYGIGKQAAAIRRKYKDELEAMLDGLYVKDRGELDKLYELSDFIARREH